MLSDDATRMLAAGVLGALVVALIAWLVGVYRRSPYRAAQFPWYMLNRVLTRILWRARIEGSLRLPPGQGAVIVSNHIGPIDPGFIALAADRPMHWMVAREYVTHPLVGWLLRTLETIPVGRAGIDTAAAKQAMRYAARGELVGVFPEGRLNDSGRLLLPGRPGAALVALRARVPVVPCFITGSPRSGAAFGFLLMTARTRLIIGQPLDISEFYGREGEREALDQLTRRLMIEIARLAGVPDYEPELAGRHWRYGMEDAQADFVGPPPAGVQ